MESLVNGVTVVRKDFCLTEAGQAIAIAITLIVAIVLAVVIIVNLKKEASEKSVGTCCFACLFEIAVVFLLAIIILCPIRPRCWVTIADDVSYGDFNEAYEIISVKNGEYLVTARNEE